MKPDKLIENKLTEIIKTLARLDDLIANLEHINTTLLETEIQIFQKYFLLDFLKGSLWNASILEICMIYNPKEDLSIFKVLNLIINNHRNLVWENKSSLHDYKNMITELKKYQDLNQKLKTIRDKLIAHKEIDLSFERPYLGNLRTLTEAAKMVCNRLVKDSMGSDLVWDNRVNNDLLWIKNLSKFEQIKAIITRAEFSKNQFIETKKLLSALK